MKDGDRSGSRESLQEDLADTESLIQHTEDRPEIIDRDIEKPTQYSRRKGVRVIVLSCLVFAIAVTIALVVDIYIGDHHTGHAAVASDEQRCSNIGLALMKRGGSAVDAAIGTLICTGVLNPESTGIGGGGFMLVVPPRKRGEVIDFRETAPGAATKDMFHGNPQLSQVGGMSVAIPGEIKGFEIAHKKFGKLKWADLFTPSIKLAREGFKLSAHTAKTLQSPGVQKKMKDHGSPRLLNMFFRNGTFLKEGDLVVNSELANTLEKIAKGGSKAFYSGEIAESIVKTVKFEKGIVTAEDLRTYNAVEKKGLHSTYQGYQLMTVPLPASGPVLVSTMNIIEAFKLNKADQGKNKTYQYLVEAFKFAYAQRTQLGDPADHDNSDMANLTRAMTSKQLAAKIRMKIFANQTFHNQSYYGPYFDAAESHGTAHVSAVGPDGEVVSVTSTINGYFGSYLMTDTGIVLNNEMDDFCSPGITNQFGIAPSRANFIKPGKRPLSSCAPVVVRHKQDPCIYRMALGASGGTRITTAIIQTLVNILSFGNSLTEAVERPRVHHQFYPDRVEAEGDIFSKYNESHVISYLRHVGHNVSTTGNPRADVNVAENYHSTIRVHSDSRRAGSGTAQY